MLVKSKSSGPGPLGHRRGPETRRQGLLAPLSQPSVQDLALLEAAARLKALTEPTDDPWVESPAPRAREPMTCVWQSPGA